MDWIDEAEEQADRNVLETFGKNIGNQPIDFADIERRQDVSGGIDSLIDREPVFLGGDGARPLNVQGIETGTVLPPDQQHVAKALGGNECDRLPSALQKGVCGDG